MDSKVWRWKGWIYSNTQYYKCLPREVELRLVWNFFIVPHKRPNINPCRPMASIIFIYLIHISYIWYIHISVSGLFFYFFEPTLSTSTSSAILIAAKRSQRLWKGLLPTPAIHLLTRISGKLTIFRTFLSLVSSNEWSLAGTLTCTYTRKRTRDHSHI